MQAPPPAADAAQPHARQPIPRWAALLAIASAFVVMLAWSWGTWPEPVVDYGTQLYLAWQIAAGKVLYRDLAYSKGPLSQYVNGALFAVFGVGLRTLVVFNIIVFAAAVALIYRVSREFADRLAATAATIVAVCAFGFIQLMDIGNYNWVTPYAHEYTHGVALALGMIAALATTARAFRVRTLALAGVLCGLSFLTTAEVFAATAVSALVGLIWIARAVPGERRWRLIGAFAGAALLPPLVGFALLFTAMPAADALRDTLGSWPWVFNREIGELGFYREVMGLHDTGWSIRRMLTILAGYVAILGPVVAIAFFARRSLPKARAITAIATAAIVVIVLRLGWQWFPWYEIARPWPLFVAVIAIASLVQLWRRPTDAALAVRLMFAAFAFVLLGKMILNASVRHYGFVLAMPAAVLIVEAIVGWLPRAIDRAGGAGIVFRGPALAACAMVTAALLYGFHLYSREKTIVVGSGADAFLSDVRGDEANLVLRAIEHYSKPGETLAVLPQGLMLNYLARRPHPNAYLNFMPPEVISTGEGKIIAAYDRNPPDVVVLIGDVTEPEAFVLPEAGYRYGRAMRAWVERNYVEVGIVRHSRSPHGWRIMRRRSNSATATATSLPATAPAVR